MHQQAVHAGSCHAAGKELTLGAYLFGAYRETLWSWAGPPPNPISAKRGASLAVEGFSYWARVGRLYSL